MPVSGTLTFPPANSAVAVAALQQQRLASFPANPESQCGKINWCWAAVAQAVLHCFGVPMTQREIVLQCHPGNEDDDKPFPAFQAMRKLKLAYERNFEADIARFVTRHCAAQPVPINILWGNGASHAICALGTDMLAGEPALLIYDPQPPSCPSNGHDLIKLVTVAALGGSYLEASSKQARGRWVDACRVTGMVSAP
ncbi:hypothetical protein CHU93_16835 [Sandarakinorhabdus cyanobacteriorum]|uniref:Peptidase C39-like domain-containing protein n=1 Tax=Sandarakinorhabdus cyanobacteriorum TaxID=1981098 RepID=A0A255Y3R6_9SPHN|nr:hypothetical protein [Sandarakinorhabdus cyanobacteriorum]OYQ23858.1 hypothetical protein CHU93_16835 [Sandarakinorhabdus cyanobacteriorum]